MTFTDSIKTCFNKYATFSGRAKRSEFWWFQLFYAIAFIVAQAIHPVLALLVFLGCIVPLLAVQVRRLHDTDHSGWYFLFILIPFIGPFILLYWNVIEGTKGPNQFGN